MSNAEFAKATGIKEDVLMAFIFAVSQDKVLYNELDRRLRACHSTGRPCNENGDPSENPKPFTNEVEEQLKAKGKDPEDVARRLKAGGLDPSRMRIDELEKVAV